MVCFDAIHCEVEFFENSKSEGQSGTKAVVGVKSGAQGDRFREGVVGTDGLLPPLASVVLASHLNVQSGG